MDRHAFLDSLPYLRPCSRDQLGTPVWSGAASFSFSLLEQYSAVAQDAPEGAFAKDVTWLYFSVSERTCEDATQLRAALHVGTSAGAPEGTPPDFANLPLLIVICNFAGLLPLPFLFLLDEVPGLADAEAAKAGVEARAGAAEAADVEMTRPPTDDDKSD